MAIDLHDELIENCRGRHLRVKIRNYYCKWGATALRKEIVSRVSKVSGVMFTEMWGFNSRTFSKSKIVVSKLLKKPSTTKNKTTAMNKKSTKNKITIATNKKINDF